MSIPGRIIIGCWIAFLVYWLVSAVRVKAVAERQSFGASLAYRIPVITGAILIFSRRIHGPLDVRVLPDTNWVSYGGALVCVAGLIVCIWARVTLAGNWSSNVTFKQGHELIRRGPYRFVRHPIYTGILLMYLGTAIHLGLLRAGIGVLLTFIGFWIKYRQEEALMLQHFPDQYPVYRKRVKALVPWVF
jgi:protein-S-isoprenylcysteine O-methyltransferase Ste14